MTTSTVKLSEIIAPPFYTIHEALRGERYTHYLLKGGRGSSKSSFVSEEIILGMMKHPDANAVVIRKVGLYLKDSVYEQLVWAIEKLGVSHLWTQKLSPLCLIYKGQKILFRGADKPKKLKSTKVSRGYIRYIWYEELDEFLGKQEIDNINQSLMRGGEKFEVFYTYNPPKTPRSWVNNFALESRSDMLVHHSDYRDVPAEWLGRQFFAEAEYMREKFPDRYRHEYLGEVTGSGAEVFPNVVSREITDDEIATFDRVRRGIDWGFGADPFVYVALNYDSTARRIIIYHEFYKCGAKFDNIAAEIRAENTENSRITADCEPRSNSELTERGLRVTSAKKGRGSVEHGITWLQNLAEIVIDPTRCPNTFREFYGYELDSDNNGGFRDGFPDRDNHSIDAVRYALEADMLRKKAKTHDRKELGIY